MKVRKAVIPAAGLGTRFLPATKVIPKEMIPIIDKPMIQYIVEECVNAGIEEIIFVTARGKESIERHFGSTPELEIFLKNKKKDDLLQIVEDLSRMAKIKPVIQEEALGLGHAVLTALPEVGDEPFAVVLGDDLVVSKVPCIRQLIDVYEKHQTSVIGVMEVPREEVSKYGIVGGPQMEKNLIKVTQMVEKPSPQDAPSCFACPGRYVLEPSIFKILKETKPGKGGEIQLTDALAKLASQEGLLAYLFEGQRHDTGDKLGYIEATIAFALERPEFADSIKKYMKSLLG